MRHAIVLFSFCLLIPHAAQACLPIGAANAGENFLSTMSWLLGFVYLGYLPFAVRRIRRTPKNAPGYALARRKLSISWKLALLFIAFPFASAAFDIRAAAASVVIAFILYKIVLPTLAWLVRRGANALHSIKIAGEKTSSTRRLAAAGDVQ